MTIEIMHYHAENGKIKLTDSHSAIPAIVQLAAITELRKYNYDGSRYNMQYPTNSAGLKVAIDQAEQIIYGLTDAIEAISLLVVHADVNELGDRIKSVGYLVSALSELIGYASFHGSEMRTCLENQQAQKNPTN